MSRAHRCITYIIESNVIDIVILDGLLLYYNKSEINEKLIPINKLSKDKFDIDLSVENIIIVLGLFVID